MVYEIPKNKNVLLAFKYANIQVPNKIILKDLRKVCEKNLENSMIPINYQYVWYCLNGINIIRKRKNKLYTPKVVCYPFYIQNNYSTSKIIKLAVKKIGSRKHFGELVNRSTSRVCDWVNGKIKIPITAFLKACQILNIDPWKNLKGNKLFGQNKKESLCFRNLDRNKIIDILAWIKFEGHISLSQGRIEIEQKDVGKNALYFIKERISKEFGVKTSIYKRKRRNREGYTYSLRINSTVLKQILFLCYSMDFGHKSTYVNLKNEIKNIKTKEEIVKILTCAMETEGHFGFTKYKNKLYPKCNFTSLNKDMAEDVQELFQRLDFSPSLYKKDKTCWRVSLTKDCVKFYKLILPHFNHQKKLNIILEAISQK